MDTFEKYLREHRRELDEVEEPRRETIWSAIRTGLPQTSARREGWTLHIGVYWRWSIAASLALLIGAGFWWYAQPAKGPAANELVQFYPELAEQERAFQHLVAEKENELQLSSLDPKEYEDIFHELHILDEVHRQFRQDLPFNFSEEELIPALLKYYERKIRILERLSREIEKRKHDEKKQHERLL